MVDQSFSVKRRISDFPLFARKQPLLNHIDIELTERCNNACMHCYINLPANDRPASRRELMTSQWQEILSQAADLGALSVRFTGGEPLLRSDFAEIYLFTRRLGLKVYLFTNARLITSELANLLAKVPPLKKIEISVYGMHPESYDAVTCAEGAFSEFQRGIKLLWERQVPFVIKSVVLPPNRAEQTEYKDWATTIPWMDKPPTYSLMLDLRTRRDSPARNRLISSLRLSPEEVVKILTRDEERYRKATAQFCAGFMGLAGDKLFDCPAGDSGCIDAYGVYQVCMLLRHPKMTYDLKHGTLKEALTEVFPNFLKTRATNPDYLNRCARCFLKGLCEQCPAKSWTENGTLDTPVEYLCEVAHAQACFLGLLDDHERAWEIDLAVSRERLAHFVSSQA